MKPYVPSAWGFGSLQALQQAIQLADWVGAVTLRRVWPGELHAIVALRKPVAMLDDITYVDRQAQVFHALRPLKGAVPVQWFAEEDDVSDVFSFQSFIQQSCLKVYPLQAIAYRPNVAWRIFLAMAPK